MSAWRRFCACRDRYARSLVWLVCACERRPALSFVGVGAALLLLRVCAPVLVPVACWLRGGRCIPVATVVRLRDVWRACVDARCFACERVVVVLLPPCGARWRACRLVVFLRPPWLLYNRVY